MDGVLFAVAIVVLGLVLVSQVGLWTVQYQVVKQQGRLLLWLDELAERVGDAGPRPTEVARGVDGGPWDPAPAAAQLVGHVVPPFRLPDLRERLVGIEEYLGKRVLLIHWNPDCGYCALIAPDLARLRPELEQSRVQVVLVSYGAAEANRQFAAQYHLEYPILLQESSRPIEVFRGLGTPVAYVLDEKGLVAESLAVGADQVLSLVRATVSANGSKKHLPEERPLSTGRIERDGLKAGTPAPPFQLPEVRGGTVVLESYRGRRVLLVFTDPQCGPCDALGPDLARLSREGRRAGMELVVISRRSVEENRRKAEQYGIESPIALQMRWEVSKAYGIFATPVGFLIDEKGVIEKDVAKGPDSIVALAREALAIEKEGSR